MGVFKQENLDHIESEGNVVTELSDNYVEVEIGFGIDLHILETYLEYGLEYAGPGENGFVFKKV